VSDIDAVHAFWIGPEATSEAELGANAQKWFGGGPALDDEIRTKFGALVEQARAGALDHWHASPRGSIAWLVLVDQFSRNLYRSHPESFSKDPTALRWAREGWDRGAFAGLTTGEKLFAILPFEHAEDLDAQRRACVLMIQAVLAAPVVYQKKIAGWVDFARKHLDVVARFGRFPHRNEVLGRESTPGGCVSRRLQAQRYLALAIGRRRGVAAVLLGSKRNVYSTYGSSWIGMPPIDTPTSTRCMQR
jgi:uncharacterized protein (DUF924 family)